MTLLAQQQQGGPLPFPDIPPPPVLDEISMVFWTCFIIGFVLAFGLVFWLILKPKASAQATVERPLKQAIRTLKNLHNRASGLSISQISAEVSQTLRSYYEQRYHIPALKRTSQELFPQQAPEHEGRQQRQWRERFNGLSEIYDWLEFSSEPASHVEAVALIENAITRLEEERLQYDEVD